jgi:hypothetical protein
MDATGDRCYNSERLPPQPRFQRSRSREISEWGVANRVRFVTRDLFTSNISEATVVTLYLLQSINERLRPTAAAFSSGRFLTADRKPRRARFTRGSSGPLWP